MLLLLVRHSETAYNAVGRYQGHVQIELNARGQHQAARVCRRLAQRSIQAIYSSDLVRCLQTIQPLVSATSLPLTLDHRLREIDVGLWEHLTIPEIGATYPGNYAAYKQNPGATVHVGGESYQHLQQRAVAAIQDIIGQHGPDDSVVICTHGGTIRAIACWLLALDVNHYNKMWIDNCALTTLRIHDGHIRLVSLNDNAHAEETIVAPSTDQPPTAQGTIV
jgi:alpha-ribazole phosphatase/probable phosphoglycerate mutase